MHAGRPSGEVRVESEPISASLIINDQASTSSGASDKRHERAHPAVVKTLEAGEILIAGIQPTHGVPHKLRAAGHTLSFAKTAADARRFVNERIPVAILLGPGPRPDPYEVVRWLREQDRLAFVQIFVFSTPRSGSRLREALTVGADDVFDLSDDSHSSAEETAERIVARIARARLMTELALLDPLTGLHNRRFLNDRLPPEIARAARKHQQLSIALLDLDHFKTINDTLGHAVGDRVLTSFARALERDLRAYDILCRWGGDEFVVLFPDCSLDGAHRALRQLRSRHSWMGGAGDPDVTFSAGVVQCPESGTSWPELFEAADHNLRLAKRRGRSLSV